MGNRTRQNDDGPGTPDRAPAGSDDRVDRRRFIVGAIGTAGVAGLTLAGCGSSGSSAGGPTTSGVLSGTSTTAVDHASGPVSGASTPATTADVRACRLIPEMTSGPYYLEDMAVRRDITEDRVGFPLTMAFTVIDATTCEPLRDAAVDIWCCDANGEYAGWNGNTLQQTFTLGRNDNTFLRGIQLTGVDGVATFDMVYPGWYEGRAIHIHLKVHTGGEAAATYTGGHVNHVGQVFFDDDLSDRLMALDPYATHTGRRTRNDEDTIYLDGGADQLVAITPIDPDDPTAGFHGAVTLAVDPDAVPDPLPVA